MVSAVNDLQLSILTTLGRVPDGGCNALQAYEMRRLSDA
jgi:hypothetical protein